MKVWKEIKALGTDVLFLVDAKNKEEGAREIEKIIESARQFEKRFSRFLENNELAEFNRASGEIPTSPEMFSLLKASKQAYSETGGIFDPTIIVSLEKIGYEKSFGEKTAQVEIDRAEIQKNFFSREGMEKLDLDEKKLAVAKPAGLKIEFGGIGKGYFVDLAAKEFKKYFQDFWISAGGDIFLSGKDEGRSWEIEVQHPLDQEKNIAVIESKKENLSLATSGIVKRRGEIGGFEWHHIIDPRTGLPVENEILSVTAIAPDVLSADVFAKTVLILGIKEGIEFINRKDCACLIITKNLDLVLSDKMSDYLKK